jgi:hypothetical protein
MVRKCLSNHYLSDGPRRPPPLANRVPALEAGGEKSEGPGGKIGPGGRAYAFAPSARSSLAGLVWRTT